MKSLISLRKTKSLKIGLAAVAAVSFAVAQAEPVKPTGPYSESKLEGAAPGEKPPQQQGLQGEVKTWVKNKWSSLKSYASKWAPATPTQQPNRVLTSPNKTSPRSPAQDGSAGTQVTAQSGSAPTTSPVTAPSVAPKAPVPGSVSMTGLAGAKESDSGVVVYDIKAADKIPRLDVPKEEKIRAANYALDGMAKKVMDQRIIHPFDTPDLLPQNQFVALTKAAPVTARLDEKIKDPVFFPKGKVSREAFDKIVMKLAPEAELKLKKFTPLTPEEFRFLSGLLLYQQGDKCAAAVGLFHKLSKSKEWQSEADYYLAMCSKKLGLLTDFHERARRIVDSQDVHYTSKILKEIDVDIPYEFTESLGAALSRASSNAKIMDNLDAKTRSNVAYWLAEYGASTGKFKTTQAWAKQVPDNHPKRLHARFLHALAEYQVGSKKEALSLQANLINDMRTDSQRAEFQAVIALNAARMYFQEKEFKTAQETFLKVYKDHPLWLQSLTEMGWAQLMSGDYEGAIGNMYSIQSPFFSIVYKPESYVIRTIGYLNLCQYGDAYRTLSLLERYYRPWLGMMETYTKENGSKAAHYQTVRNYLLAEKAAAEKKTSGPKQMDGLPVPVIREMARHKDFTNSQKALNRQLDERLIYDRFDVEVDKSLKRAQWLVNNSRRRADELRKKMASIAKNPQLEQNRNAWSAELNKELEVLNDHFFHIDLFNDAKADLPTYKKDVVGGADARIAGLRSKIEKTLANRLQRMKTDLARILENNELLRYEVFAGSGENIRYQVAGGQNGNRVPASVMPKSKSLQWDFDGEYWEDEIGHYRSSLKNNCPESAHRGQASLGGGVE